MDICKNQPTCFRQEIIKHICWIFCLGLQIYKPTMGYRNWIPGFVRKHIQYLIKQNTVCMDIDLVDITVEKKHQLRTTEQILENKLIKQLFKGLCHKMINIGNMIQYHV